jgi:hypothetical protein
MSKHNEAIINVETYLTSIGLQNSPSWIEIKQTLTPPTSDKVCEELGKHFNSATYDDETNEFIVSLVQKEKYTMHGIRQEHIHYFSIVEYINDTLIFNHSLPVYLATLISRFYEMMSND